jgi:hypothetical protein
MMTISPRVWLELEKATEEELRVVKRYIEDRLTTASHVLERRNYQDGWLQLEVRYTERGTERGPYWYYKFVRDGRNHTLYIGQTDDPESKVIEKLREERRD